MQLIDWRFSEDLQMGTRVCSVGFDAAGQGLELGPIAELYASEQTFGTADGWIYEIDCADTQPTLVSGLVVVHATINVPNNGMALPSELAVRYGGLDMEFDAEYVQTSEVSVFELLAYLWVGDAAELADMRLEIDLSDGGYSGGSLGSVGLSVFFVEGVAESTPGFLNAGTLNNYVSPVTLDPGPSTTYQSIITGACQAHFQDLTSTLSVATTGYEQAGESPTSRFSTGSVAFYACDTSYNCECEVDPNARTLVSMREEVLSLTGYAAQISNPPPGIANMYNGFLRRSQSYLYEKYKALQTERFFSWVMEPGVRYYGLRDNVNCCDVKLNRYKITGAWVQDLNNTWWPLVHGIDPTFYTLDQNFGWPNYYEIRQCVEVFPAPQAAYKLWIKGHFDLLPFLEDDDLTTIDSEPVLNYAIFLAKASKGMKDATVYRDMALDAISSLIAGAHVTNRYIPGTAEIPVPTPPVMVHFDS